MKVSTGCNVKKHLDLESGGADKPIEILVSKNLKSSRCFSIIKFIFYLELITFIGLLGFMALQTYFERPRFPPSPVTEGFVETNDLDSDIIKSTTEAPSIIEGTRESQDIYKSPLLQEMTNKIQKLVDAIDKLSDSDNSERELSKYREVFKPFLSDENTDNDSHEIYNSRIFDVPVIIASSTIDSENIGSFRSSDVTQRAKDLDDETSESDLTVKSFPDLVDDIDNHEDSALPLKFDDVFQLRDVEVPESSEESVDESFGIAEKESFDETSTISEDNEDFPSFLGNIEEDREVVGATEGMIEDTEQVPFADVIPETSEVTSEGVNSEEYEVFGQNEEDSNSDDVRDSGTSVTGENYSSFDVSCAPGEIEVAKLRSLGLSLGFTVPDDWIDCVDADVAFDVLMRPISAY